MPTLFEAGFKVLLIILFFSGFQALLGGFGLVGGGVSIHHMHIMNTVHTLRTEVSDEEISLQLLPILQRGTFEFVLLSVHGVIYVYYGVIKHVCWGEGLARKAGKGSYSWVGKNLDIVASSMVYMCNVDRT